MGWVSRTHTPAAYVWIAVLVAEGLPCINTAQKHDNQNPGEYRCMGAQLPFALLDESAQGCDFVLLSKFRWILAKQRKTVCRLLDQH